MVKRDSIQVYNPSILALCTETNGKVGEGGGGERERKRERGCKMVFLAVGMSRKWNGLEAKGVRFSTRARVCKLKCGYFILHNL